MWKTALIYTLTVLIWGTSWIAQKYQLGSVDLTWSLAYRFGISAAFLFALLRLRGEKMLPPLSAWKQVALIGLMTFSVNYLLLYLATERLTSGLISVASATLVLFNVVNAKIFLGQNAKPAVMIGAVLGFLGIGVIMAPQLQLGGSTGGVALGLALALLAAYLGSAASTAVARARSSGVPLLPFTASSMATGALVMAAAGIVRGVPPTIVPSFSYVGSLLYLSLFCSTGAFLGYFLIIERIGIIGAGCMSIIIPIFALIISTIFEGYQWSIYTFIGMTISIIGNALVLIPSERLLQLIRGKTLEASPEA